MTPLHGHEHGCWLALLRRYLLAVFGGNLLWEFAQLPLYAIWQTGTADRWCLPQRIARVATSSSPGPR